VRVSIVTVCTDIRKAVSIDRTAAVLIPHSAAGIGRLPPANDYQTYAKRPRADPRAIPNAGESPNQTLERKHASEAIATVLRLTFLLQEYCR
jgi:hypothetical protein